MSKHDKVVREIAKSHGISVDKVNREIQKAIDAAWNNPDLEVKTQQRLLFPKGKPTIDEFIDVVSKHVKDSDSPTITYMNPHSITPAG
jgi:hypothetical protein